MFSNNAVSGIEWAAYKSSGFDCSYAIRRSTTFVMRVTLLTQQQYRESFLLVPPTVWMVAGLDLSRDVSEHVTRAYLRSTLWIYFVFN